MWVAGYLRCCVEKYRFTPAAPEENGAGYDQPRRRFKKPAEEDAPVFSLEIALSTSFCL